MSDSAHRKRTYQRAHARHGATPKAMQWKDYPAAARRYVQLTADLAISGRTILDAGCGMGDLLPYLYARALDFDYLGMDITPEFINIARERYAGHRFEVGDPFASDASQRFDIIISSGVLNASHDGWMEARKVMVRQLFELTDEVLAFNMAGGSSPAEGHGKVAYADVETVIGFCYELTPKLIVRNQYHPRDFTVLLYK